jgi:phosphodiesterase/alkaline phosphatase D-like protein
MHVLWGYEVLVVVWMMYAVAAKHQWTFKPSMKERNKNQMDMLVMVGAVSSSSARVVYEPLMDELLSQNVTLSLFHLTHLVEEYSHEHKQAFPYTHTFQGLKPYQTYYVMFRWGEAVLATAEFRTLPSNIIHAPLVLHTVSCDRFSADNDDRHWLTLAADISANISTYWGMLHIGDQVYADDIVLKHSNAPYETVLQAFRALYRRMFGRPAMQQVLRRGAHWMMLDDHDLMNNWYGLQLHPIIVRAGLQAYYEYQYALREDADVSIDFRTASSGKMYRPQYHTMKLGQNISLVFLDTRLERGLTVSRNMTTSS